MRAVQTFAVLAVLVGSWVAAPLARAEEAFETRLWRSAHSTKRLTFMFRPRMSNASAQASLRPSAEPSPSQRFLPSRRLHCMSLLVALSDVFGLSAQRSLLGGGLNRSTQHLH
jgi:hypothetical protein